MFKAYKKAFLPLKSRDAAVIVCFVYTIQPGEL
jgi:hypothetical protein